jgi:DNA (cytosine-5)-methyltransferase 1
MDPIAISVGYKALEDAIKKVEGIDDLVQLSGYYQYRSKISTTVLEPGLLRLPEYLPVKYVLEGQLAGMMSISEIGRKLDIPSGDVMRKLSALRKLGFEIRNSSTNPQIPEGSVLFPYTFPSLRSRSVQTHKVFFSE